MLGGVQVGDNSWYFLMDILDGYLWAPCAANLALVVRVHVKIRWQR